MSLVVEYVVIEYLEPYAPANRRIWEPVAGLGPLVFKATPEQAAEFLAIIGGAPGPFRVMPVATAVKCGLMQRVT